MFQAVPVHFSAVSTEGEQQAGYPNTVTGFVTTDRTTSSTRRWPYLHGAILPCDPDNDASARACVGLPNLNRVGSRRGIGCDPYFAAKQLTRR
jgi:hypothetical protein